jgi:nucleoside-diphosphate-sugar epimerase
MKTLVVGTNSFIAKRLIKFDSVSHEKFDHIDLTKYNNVINCALNPSYITTSYDENLDFDFYVAKKSVEKNCHYMMLSTSKVYGNNTALKIYDENSLTNPFDYYSENKLITENKLLSNFNDKVIILRLANIFGFEIDRSSFVGYLMSQMVREKKIKLTIPESTKRDFLFVNDAVDIIEKICYNNINGIYNLSSNSGYEARNIIDNLVYGYDQIIKIEDFNQKPDRQFIMDNTKLENVLQIEIGPFNYDDVFKQLGEQLARFSY